MSENMVRLLKFAIQYRGWHPFGADAARSIYALERKGFVEIKTGLPKMRWFRLKPPL
jgi:hypothetical protein